MMNVVTIDYVRTYVCICMYVHTFVHTDIQIMAMRFDTKKTQQSLEIADWH